MSMKPAFGIAHEKRQARLVSEIARTLVLAAVALFGSQPLSHAATTLIVNNEHPSASNSNPGTESLPLLTIQAAANLATAGTTVHVREGVYNEMVTVSKSGHAGAMISFVVDGDDHVVVDSPSYACFNLRGAKYIKIRGFELTGAYLSEGGDEVAHGGGIRAYPKRLTMNAVGASNCVFANNVIHDNDAGIWLVLSHSNFIRNNVIFRSNAAPIHLKRGHYNRVINNLAFNNGQADFVEGELGERFGILFYGAVGTKVVHNTVVEPTGGGVYIYEGTANLNGAIPGTRDYCPPSKNAMVRDNVLVITGSEPPGGGAPLVIGSSMTTDRAPLLDELYGPINNIYISNLFFNESQPNAIVSWGDLRVEVLTFPHYALLTLPAFQSKHPGYGAGSIVGDPMFVDAENGDFTLAANSPAKGQSSGGTDMGVDMTKLPAFSLTAALNAGR